MTRFVWYDYETTGLEPATARPVQFAAVRTDAELRQLGDPIVWYCQPAPDLLPDPEAALVHGITPQLALARGLPEGQFAERVHELLCEPDTCSVGYNSIRYDDQVNRFLFYRNLLPPYEHTWRNGNSRWDVIDLVRACCALRPDGMAWPLTATGNPSFHLTDLTQANGIEHTHAHDAAADALATLALARRLRDLHPELFRQAFELRRRRQVAALLVPERGPLVYAAHGQAALATRGLRVVWPVVAQAGPSEAVLAVDLIDDPGRWLQLDTAALAAAWQSLQDPRRPWVHCIRPNQAPFLAPLRLLRAADAARLGIDLALVMQHWQRLRTAPHLPTRLRAAIRPPEFPAPTDPERALYGHFASAVDEQTMARIRAVPFLDRGALRPRFKDPRFETLWFRYRARNLGASLDAAERARWRDEVRQRLAGHADSLGYTLDAYFAALDALDKEYPQRRRLLAELREWGLHLRHNF